jgi:hypothetical protein
MTFDGDGGEVFIFPVTHITVGSLQTPEPPWSTAEPPRLPKQKQVELCWQFVAGKFGMWKMFFALGSIPNHH